MRRLLILICLLFLAAPIAINLAGCSSNKNAAYCNGLGFGPKRTAVATINLDPKVTGISLAFGQTGQLLPPSASSCSPAEPVGISRFDYGTTNHALADVSPTGSVCGGTWNKTSAGGIANYTICTPPVAGGGTAYLTASAGGATSNTVAIYVHPVISSITILPQTTCVSQGRTLGTPFSAETTVTFANGTSGKATDQNLNVGNLTYSAVDPSIVSIDTTGVATAQNPGSTAITATLSQTSSAAGYFSTCPPTSISLAFADGSSSKTVQQGSPQPLTAVVKDVNGVTLTGVNLQYTSTSPTVITANLGGIVTSTFPGSAAITAICQPVSCNSAPIDQIGVNGNGKPIVSNSVQVTAVGLSSNYLWISGTGSQSFVPIDLTTGTVGAAVRLPYFPNSMILNQAGTSLYFGSYRELMIYTTPVNALTTEDTNVPGVVLAVSPDGTTVVINDQLRKVIYLYNTATARSTSFGGVATTAAYTPDGKTLYVAGPDNLYIFSAFTGWSTYPLTGNEPVGSQCIAGNNLNNSYLPPGAPNPPYNPFCAPGLAITVPSVGGFVAGAQTLAHGFCPDTSNPATPSYYPLAATVGASTDQLAATNDGMHILGAQASTPPLFSDIAVSIPIGRCPDTKVGLTIPTTLNQVAIPGIAPAQIDQVVADPNSSLAFVTYSAVPPIAGTPALAGVLPYYLVPAAGASGAGTIGSIPLAAPATAPVVGIFSPDNSVFFTGTSGDNFVHYIDMKTLTDSKQINPKLLNPQGQPVPPEFLAVKPRPVT